MSSKLPTILAASHLLFAALALACPLVTRQLLARPLELATARHLQRLDLVNGIAATLVLVIGVVRLLHFGKGPDYYLHSLPFLAKLGCYAIASGLSVPTTLEILRWKPALKGGHLPIVLAGKLWRMRRLAGWQAACVLAMMVCAMLAARGVGSLR